MSNVRQIPSEAVHPKNWPPHPPKKMLMTPLMATVGAFSIGLAVALVGVGVIAAWGMGQASRRFGRVYDLARRLPYLSSLLVLGIGVLMTVSGWSGLTL